MLQNEIDSISTTFPQIMPRTWDKITIAQYVSGAQQ